MAIWDERGVENGPMHRTWKRPLISLLAPVILLSLAVLVEAATCVVAPGDTLFLLAQRYGTTVSNLMRQNGLASATIYPGQRFTVTAQFAQAGGYVVKSGDTLFLIAKRYGISVESLKTANSMTSDYLQAGRGLTIPGASSGSTSTGKYTVQSGDTFYLLAVRFGTTIGAIQRANGLSGTMLYTGQQLSIPSSGGQSTPTGISQADLELLARVVSAESAGEPYIGQVAVAATILNRLNDPKYPKTIADVIYQYTDGAYQYSPVMDGRINEPASDSAIAAVYDALNGWDPSYGANGFYNPYKTDNPWVLSQPVTTSIGDHVFFRY